MNPEPDRPGVPGGCQVLGRALVPALVALDCDGNDQAASGVDEHSETLRGLVRCCMWPDILSYSLNGVLRKRALAVAHSDMA